MQEAHGSGIMSRNHLAANTPTTSFRGSPSAMAARDRLASISLAFLRPASIIPTARQDCTVNSWCSAWFVFLRNNIGGPDGLFGLGLEPAAPDPISRAVAPAFPITPSALVAHYLATVRQLSPPPEKYQISFHYLAPTSVGRKISDVGDSGTLGCRREWQAVFFIMGLLPFMDFKYSPLFLFLPYLSVCYSYD